ncbi:metalloprotease PmbA [Candidatus Symbiobacter mobilis]|uniref:PmbA protein n=1 Tax=Candidatus Symbiobacter mobilis CR TaxID=946483 RepID=U5N700_9BURK|nr:metalloprotease PmbA [Candidatus Symbiobacter mobilis]AGX87162.1 PmbA protein [Candidatus Symbiobacter mobilis CR]
MHSSQTPISAHPPASDPVLDGASGFVYDRAALEGAVDFALDHAARLGCSDASAYASESCGLEVSVRNTELESVERSRDKSLGVTVYVGHRSGHASTTDLAAAAIARTVQAAFDIARFTAEDPCAALPDLADVVLPAQQRGDLELFFPWLMSTTDATELALHAERAALELDPRITNSEGGSVAIGQSQFFHAHTHGFRGGYASSMHSVFVGVIAGADDAMQRDGWSCTRRHPLDLESPESIGRRAAERALGRLGARKLATTECPVLFEAPVAVGLIGHFVQAVSGGALYRRSSFLLDALGQRVFPEHIDIAEDPFLPRGRGSVPFDAEGVRVQPRNVVEAGTVQGYFLGSYSARKLGMRTTGNAGGSHNLRLYSRNTTPGDSLEAMLERLGTGLFVTELLGSGVNPVTGDYSRGACGYWVERGRIAFPVHEVTIAGNLRTMYQELVAVGADAYTLGAKTTGSILLRSMKVAGA